LWLVVALEGEFQVKEVQRAAVQEDYLLQVILLLHLVLHLL
jgi:hypothetical protein